MYTLLCRKDIARFFIVFFNHQLMIPFQFTTTPLLMPSNKTVYEKQPDDSTLIQQIHVVCNIEATSIKLFAENSEPAVNANIILNIANGKSIWFPQQMKTCAGESLNFITGMIANNLV